MIDADNARRRSCASCAIRPLPLTAFVLSGGASLGAVQVGMLQALGEHGIRPDLLVGTSVGALNAGWMAAYPETRGLDGLAEVWRRMTRDHVFRVTPPAAVRALLGRRNHLVSPDGLRSLFERHLTFSRLEHAAIPLHVIATDLLTGQDVVLSHGEAVPALMASCAIPGVYPPVRIGARYLVDGSIAANMPVSQAVRLGATQIYVLPTGGSRAAGEVPRTALGIVVHALKLLLGRTARDFGQLYADVELNVLPAPGPPSLRCIDFSRADELIRRGRESTLRWLSRATYGALQGGSQVIAS